jgi:hypothetical protein
MLTAQERGRRLGPPAPPRPGEIAPQAQGGVHVGPRTGHLDRQQPDQSLIAAGERRQDGAFAQGPHDGAVLALQRHHPPSVASCVLNEDGA